MTTIESLKAFLDKAHSPYHAAAGITGMLKQAGYTRLREQDTWGLLPGGKYYLTRGDSTVIAFRIPETAPLGFMMCASHNDHPTFQVKDNFTLKGTYTRLAVENYGGMLMAPWLDRPLSIAGRVLVQTDKGLESRLLDIDRDLLLMPNVAIHMNRAVNEGKALNPAVDMIPLAGSPEAEEKLKALLQEAAGDGEILGHDLVLYIRQKATVWGVEEDYISSAGLDDLVCAWCSTQGFLNAKSSKAIPVLCVFDNEEIGSATTHGAGSDVLESVLERICRGRGLDMNRMLSQSFLISADNAHAVHPNHPEYADAGNAPVMNSGVALKFHSNRSYTTDGLSSAIFRQVCRKAQVPVQNYYNRADMGSGSTLGKIAIAHVSVPMVDVGIAQLAMHSCYETAGVKDVQYLLDAMTAYYSLALQIPSENEYVLI